MDTNTVTGVSGNTNGHKYCHTVYLQTQIDTNTATKHKKDTNAATGVCGMWKHKLIQILSLEHVKTQTDTNTVKGMCGNTN